MAGLPKGHVSDELIRPEHLHIPALEARSSLPDNNTINFNVSLSVKDLSLEAITKKILDIALQYSSGNKSKAAALLKINRKAFYR